MSEDFLLDTNIASELTRPSPDPRVIGFVAAYNRHHLSVITVGELRSGFSLLPLSKRRLHLERWFLRELLPLIGNRIVPVTRGIAERWGALSAQRQLTGTPLSMADGLIAATALEHNLTLLTRNVKDFRDLSISLLNPWETT